MIHILEDNYIDVSKLERISKIALHRVDYHYVYQFRYSVNGFTWDVTGEKCHLMKLREDLLHSWYLYKLGEIQ